MKSHITKTQGLPYQRGAVLLVLLLIITSAAASVLISRPADTPIQIGAEMQTVAALARAKAALLGYAAADANRPGELPCPDFNNDGSIRLFGAGRDYIGSQCRTGANQPGWLPWDTLGLADLRDGNGDRLWYVVSDTFHAGGAASINSDTSGQLVVDGNHADPVIAILFSPGQILSNQPARPGYENANAGNASVHLGSFLDPENSDGDLDFASARSKLPGSNDRLLSIRRSELLRVVEKRVLAEMKNLLKAYHAACNYFPRPAAFNPLATSFNASATRLEGHLPIDNAAANGSADWDSGCASGVAPAPWLKKNGWAPLSYYAVSENFTFGKTQACGDSCLSILPDTNKNKAALLIMAGSDLDAARPSNNIADYLEAGNQSINDGNFERQTIGSRFNDQVLALP